MPGATRRTRPASSIELTIRVQQELSPSKRERGRTAECAVAAFLTQQGYTLLASNYSVARLGELDLVFCRHPTHGDKSADKRQPAPTLAVVEVKARRDSRRFGGVAAALTPAKLRRIRLTTLHFQQKQRYMNNPVELLAALVQLDSLGNVQHIEIIPIEWQ